MNKRLSKLSVAAGLALVAALVMTGCASGGGSQPQHRDITVAQTAEPEKSPDPIMDGSLAGYNYYYNVFDQLTALDTNGTIVPRLATKWTHNKDFTTWTYTIRSGVKFQNGTPLKANDVAFTYDTILKNKESDNLGYMGQLKSVEATSDDTVVFHLNTSFSPWPSITTAVSIVPQAVYEKDGSEGFAKHPIGSGPFKFVSWTRGVSYVIERNNAYWGPKPQVNKVTFQTVSDEDARLNAVTSGSVDIALIAPNQVDTLKGNSGATLASRASNGSVFLGMNSSKGVLKNEKIRQAISYAINTDEIVKKVLAGRGVANNQVVAPSVTGFVKGFAGHAYDPAKAKALLAEAKYDGTQIDFQYATAGRIPMSSNVAQAIQGYLSAVGIKVKMEGMDQDSLSNIIYGTVNVKGLYLNTWAPSTMDGDMPVTNLFAGGQNDYAKLDSTAKLVKEQRKVDGQQRLSVFAALNKINVNQALILGLYTPSADYAVSSQIKWTPRADGEMVLSDVRFAN